MCEGGGQREGGFTHVDGVALRDAVGVDSLEAGRVQISVAAVRQRHMPLQAAVHVVHRVRVVSCTAHTRTHVNITQDQCSTVAALVGSVGALKARGTAQCW